jgi:hypothetical protein
MKTEVLGATAIAKTLGIGRASVYRVLEAPICAIATSSMTRAISRPQHGAVRNASYVFDKKAENISLWSQQTICWELNARFCVDAIARAADPVGRISPQRAANIYRIAEKSVWLGSVDAPDKQTAIEKGAQEFKAEAWRLYAVARR